MRLGLAFCVLFYLALAFGVHAALSWPTSSYRGHDCGYYFANGTNYAMCWAHSHSVSQNECPSNHLHHYQGWKQIPNGSYVRIMTHDHHLCAPSH